MEKSEKTSGIHNGHRQRVWREFARSGINENTPPHKVLELLLFFTIPRKDTNELAHILLNHFGDSFSNVMEASVEQLKEVPGITEYTASHIKFILEFAKYYESDKINGKPHILDRKSGSEFLVKKFMGATVEKSYLLCLDSTFKYLACPQISEGDEISVALSTRSIAEQITKTGATQVLLAHNHPRGFSVPSVQDIKTTSRIATMLSSLKVTFLVHIIVSSGEYVSIRDSKGCDYMFDL